MSPLFGWIITLAVVYLLLTLIHTLTAFQAKARMSVSLAETSVSFGVLQVVVGVALAIVAIVAAALSSVS